MKLAANMKNIFSGRVVGIGMGRQAFAGCGLIALLCMQAFAGPEGERVVNGSAQFARNGSNTVIHAANNTIIDYRSFNIAANESVQFVQPGAASRVLNRVPNAVNPSRIDGSLSANGIVYIVNSAGVYFGGRSVVNVAGLYAAAGQITNSDFINNVNHFTNLSGTVSNAGTINAGAAALIGKHAENLGTINAERGLVTMAAGDDVFIGEVGGHFMVQVAGAGQGGDTGVNNTGTINAAGGTVRLAAGDMYSLALKMPGRITGRDVKLEAAGHGTTIVSGTIDASAHHAGERGGTVQVLGDKVGLAGATIDASGPAGGGTVLIGGDFHGQGDVRTASQTTVTRTSTIRADATDHGDAGKVVVWADGNTRFYGSISAKGGTAGGDGGQVEVSGKHNLDFKGAVDTRATTGNDGSLLLDPDNIVIQAAVGGDDGEVGPGDGDVLFGDGAGTFTIGRTALESILGNITLQANNDINVNTTLTLTNQGAGESVVFRAGNDITIDGSITTSGASIDFTANDAGGTQSGVGSIFINQPLSTAGANGVAGDISLNVSGGTGAVQIGANLQTDGGNITIADPVVLTADNLSFDTEQGDDDTAGNIDLSGATLSAAVASPSTLSLTLDTSVAGGTAGNISLGTVGNAGGSFLNDLVLNAAGSTSGQIDLSGNISLDSSGGDFASLSMTGSGVVLHASTTIDMEQGNDGSAGSVDFGSSTISAAGASIDLAINTSTSAGGGAGGAVTLPGFGNAGGNFVNDLTVVTSGLASSGAINLTGDILLDANGGDLASFAPVGNELVVAAASVSIDTEQGGDDDGGTVNLLGVTVVADAAGHDLIIDTSTAAANGGAVSLGLVGNGSQTFLNDLLVATGASTTAGALTLSSNISLDNSAGDAGDFTVAGNGIILTTGTITIDTEQANDGAGGNVDLGTGVLTTTAFGRDLTINTATTSGAAGGAVSLGVINGSGGGFLNDLAIDTSGTGAGVLTLAGNISLDSNGGDASSFVVTGAPTVLASSVTIDTEQGNDGAAGAVTLGGVSASGAGFDLTVNTATTAAASAGGAISLGAFSNAGGSFVNDTSITRAGGAGGANGALTLNGDISLDNNAGDAANFSVTDAGSIVLPASRTIDTEQGDDGPAGAITMSAATISVNAAGRDLTLDASTADAGSTGGSVALPAIGTAGGAALNDLTINAGGGAGGGTVSLPASIQLNGSADTGDLTITGASVISLAGDTTIDTDFAGGGFAGGNVSLPATATINGGNSLTIDATADGGGLGGAVNILSTLGDTTRLTNITLSGASIDLGETHVSGNILLTADDIDFVGGATSIDSNAGAGTLTVQPTTAATTIRVGASGAGTLVLDATDVGAIGTFGGGVTIGRADGTALLNIGTATFGNDTTFVEGGAGGSIGVVAGATVTTTGGSDLNFTAGSGNAGIFSQGAGASINTGAGAIAILADAIDLLGGANTISTTSTITMRTVTASRPVVIGAAGAATDFALDDPEVAAFTAGSAGITFGDATASNPVTIDAVTFNDALTIMVPMTGGDINVVGNLTGSGFNFQGDGSTITLNADIVSANNADVTLDDNVVVVGNRSVSITGPGPGGDILITGTVNANTAGADTLALSTSAGDITLQERVGNTARLGGISFSAFNTVTIGGNITVTGGGAVDFMASPNIFFAGNTTIDTDVLGGSSNGGDILFDAASAINTGAGAALSFIASADGGGTSGNITLGTVGNMGPNIPTALTALGQTVTLNGNITTAGAVVLAETTGSVALNADVVIDTTAGTDAPITVNSVSGNQALTLTGDAGSVLTVAGADVDTLTLTGGALHLGGTIETDTAQDYTNVGAITLDADTNLVAQDSDSANAPQDITTDAANAVTGAFALSAIGNNIALAAVGDAMANPTQLTVMGAGNVTLGDVQVGAATITADSDMNGAGTLTVSSGAAFTVAGGALNLTAADLALDGTLVAGASGVQIERSADGTIGVGDATGDMSIAKAELANITAASLTIGGPTKSASVTVDNVTEADLANVAGLVTIDATGNGASVTFQNMASTFRTLAAIADNGIQVNADLTTTLGDLFLNADTDAMADSSDALSIASGRTITSAGALTLNAATGDISGGGMIGLVAANGVTINDSFATGGLLSVNSDSDADGTGVTTIAAGAALSTGGADANFTGADFILDGSINAGAGTVSIERSTVGAIRLAGTQMSGELGISGAELQSIAGTGLDIGGDNTNLITVEGITGAQSGGITGVTQLNATANGGHISFVTGPSTFTTLSATADNGIDIAQDLTSASGDLSLSANSDAMSDGDDRITIAQDVDLAAGNDLLLVGNSVHLTGASGSTNTFTSGTDGNVSSVGITADNDVNLTITSENDVSAGNTVLNNGNFIAVADSDADGMATLSTAGITAGSVDLAGGSDNNEQIVLNLGVTGTNGVTIHNAASVGVAGNVTVSAPSGDVDLSNAVAGVLLSGADDSLATFSSGAGAVRLAPVTATNSPDLTVTTDGTAILSSVDVNDGNLVVDAAVTPPSGQAVSLAGGSITLNNSITTSGTDITLDGPVILTADTTLDTGAGAGNISFLSTVRSDSDNTPRSLALSSGTGDITAAAALGDMGILNQLLVQSANNVTFAAGITSSSVRQVAAAGTTTFQGNLIAQGAGGIDLDGNAFVFQSAVVTTSQGAGFTLTNTGSADFQNTANVALAGPFLQDGTGAVTLAAPITTSLAPISFGGPVTVPAAITISNNGAGNITFAGTLTTSQPLTIDGGTAGSGNINFNGAVASSGELIARTGTGSVTFASSATANSALTAATTTGAITFNGPLSVSGALSAGTTSGTISFVNTVTAGSVLSATSQSGTIQFGGAVNGSVAGAGVITLNAGMGDVLFNSGANVGGTTAVQQFTAVGRNITVRGITTQGTAAAGDGDITLTPDLTVTQNTVTEFPGQIETDNRPNGLVRIAGNLVANNGDINIGAAGRSLVPSVATTIFGDVNFAGGNLPTFTVAANSGDVNFGANDKITAFGNLSLVGRNITFSDAAVLGVFSVNAGNTIFLRQRPGALLLRPSADGMSFVRNQVDFGSNIVAGAGIGFTGAVSTTGSGGSPSFASSNGVGTGVPPQFPVAIRAPFAAADLRVGDVALGIDARGTTDTGLATALASAIPRDTEIGTVTETTSLGQAAKDQLRELRINPRDLSETELLDFLSGRSLYEDVVLDPNAIPDDYLVSVNRLPGAQVERVLETYREVFKKPRMDPNTGEQAVDPATGKALYEDRDREIRDDLAAALRRFRKEGREGTLDPVEFRRYLERTPEESAALDHVEALQKFFEQLHLLGLGPKEEDNSKRTILGRVCPSGLRVQQLEQVITSDGSSTELE